MQVDTSRNSHSNIDEYLKNENGKNGAHLVHEKGGGSGAGTGALVED